MRGAANTAHQPTNKLITVKFTRKKNKSVVKPVCEWMDEHSAHTHTHPMYPANDFWKQSNNIQNQKGNQKFVIHKHIHTLLVAIIKNDLILVSESYDKEMQNNNKKKNPKFYSYSKCFVIQKWKYDESNSVFYVERTKNLCNLIKTEILLNYMNGIWQKKMNMNLFNQNKMKKKNKLMKY